MSSKKGDEFMFEKIMYLILIIVGIIVGIPLLIIALGGVLFGIVFGEFAIWVVRIILIVIIVKLLFEFVLG